MNHISAKLLRERKGHDQEVVLKSQRRLKTLQLWTTSLNLTALTLGIPIVVAMLFSLLAS